MRGRIYSDQRCPVCDGAFQYDERRRGLFCSEHPEQRAAAGFRVQFGPRYLYKWWKKACQNLGIEGVDLYGGTRHSTALALRQFKTPEQIRRATVHGTNKAFERYFRVESDEIREIYEIAGQKMRVQETMKTKYRID
jgi:hypothetical protein